jgi:hypothetical protein
MTIERKMSVSATRFVYKIPITDEEIRIHRYFEWIWEEMYDMRCERLPLEEG